MQVLISMVLVLLVLGRGAWGDELLLSEARDISGLSPVGVFVQKSLGSYHAHTTLTYSIEPGDCTLSRNSDGRDTLAIKGLGFLNNPGRPELPMKTLTAELPRDAEVMGIEVVSGSYREILNSVSFAAGTEPRIWMRQQEIPEQVHQRLALLSLEQARQPATGYYPGEIATYSTGRDNESAHVYIRVLPVQYSPESNKAVLVTDVKINVYYNMSTAGQQAPAGPGSADTAECVIVCPAALQSAAELLRDFHAEHEGVATSVVTTEDINATCVAATDPPYPGYSRDCGGKDKIVGYDYLLAKRIVSYLRDRQLHPNLKYVTLFGDGQLVPPSYYINEYAVYEWYDFESYYDWIPTDFFYTSPDYDFVPNYRVGRLPVSDAAQAMAVVSKIARWHDALSWDWFKRASVAGGRPFGTMWYYGELCAADVINADILNGMELAKYYYTDGTYHVAHLLPLLTTEGTGLLYHVDHGSGNRLWIGDESISAADIMVSPSPRRPLFNPRAPFVVSVSCINGAYDTDLTRFEYQPEFETIPYPTSIGEAIVLSDAGGIAYVGGSRLNAAGFSAFFDEGRLLAHHYYMEGICGSVLESYHKGRTRIGDTVYDALRCYAQDNDMSWSSERETLFGFVLLGDPVLSVPAQQPGFSNQKPYLAALEPGRYSDDGVPFYEDLPPERTRVISVISSSDSPTVDVKSIYTWTDVVLGRESLHTPSLTCTVRPKGCGYHLVRSAAQDGKEGWLYLNAQYAFVSASDILLIDADYGVDYEKFYTDAIAHLGRTCDVWENGARNFVDAETLAQYDAVIWAVPFSAPSEWEKGACRSYLDGGGRLFISGQDVGSGLTSYGYQVDEFYQRYLHAEYIGYAFIDTLTGMPRDPIGGGLTVSLRGGDGADNQYSTEEIEPLSPAVPVFIYELGREAAIRVDTGIFRVVYFAFGFEGINSQRDRDEVMKRVLDWLLYRSPRGR